MKAWNFEVKNNPKEISKKLKSALGPDNGFVFDMENNENNSLTFKVRKRILFVWYMAFQNWTIVNGKLLKVNTENKTNIEIHFNQHFLMSLVIFTHIALGLGLLIAIISGISGSGSIFILGGMILALGIILWIAIQRKFEKDIEEYKSLISGILEL
ncbi:DUF423 domain-containing protein [Muricauda sp. JGD-17]|uniref:DUF423 domain-containing protein n=1 Tax=Flagellimonas ochracea TaxID=2696472 RepID=A0A964T8X2_9FLAO|nr:DUF423 domain-containing protein [Allomuricauda ochracea]NAY90410.1 DUF423 domain-containing protein [Allomuricauda ochracea]